MADGKIIQVIGPVIDAEFPVGKLPALLNALKIEEKEDKSAGSPAIDLTLEVALHLGENRVRAIAMSSTDGLVRGMKVKDMGEPISMPVGRETLGRLLNVIGEPVDNKGPVNAKRDILFTDLRPHLLSRSPLHSSLKQALRLLICLHLMQEAERQACSAALALERLLSLWSLSITLLQSMAVSLCSQALARGQGREMTSGWR